MPFESGSVIFRVCHMPQPMPEDALSRFADKAAAPLQYVKDEPQLGWVSGRHLLESRIDEETAYLGGYLRLCLRQAQRKIPASLLQAECRMAELELMSEQGQETVGRKQRKQIKQEVTERLLPDMPPQLTGIHFVVDSSSDKLYVTATSDKQFDTFAAMFHQTVGFEPIPLAPEVVAAEHIQGDISSLATLNFSPEQDDAMAGGTLGESFLTWLWFYLDQRNGVLPKTQLGEFSMMIDGPLVFVADGQGALESAIRKGLPTLAAEAKAALMVGKKLRQAKLVMARSQAEVWSVSVDAEHFIFRGLKVPEGEALDPGSIFEERMTNLYVFQTVLMELFKHFIMQLSDGGKTAAIQEEAKAWVKAMDAK
ncbi:MAG: recombination-associated protein RdgC [Candidatus Pacebacteria bacterium]|nr:recombination-associated protein RdgC [Candidatus Paceibacterota bacterium]